MNFRQVRKKIRTVSNVKKITKAMQMVASVKMKKAQDEALQGKLYRQLLDRVVSRVLGSGSYTNNLFVRRDSDKAEINKTLYIVITSNKGLCGSFNFNLFKLIFTSVDFDRASFITVGKKGSDFLARSKGEILADFSKEASSVDSVSAILTSVTEPYLKGVFSNVSLIYNSFVSTFRQMPVVVPFLPIRSKEVVDFDSGGQKDTAGDKYIIEPSEQEVVDALILDFLKDKIRGAILESAASEHSARMMAMKNATDNAEDIIINLTLLRNKLRQTTITNELLDATTAKESSDTSSI